MALWEICEVGSYFDYNSSRSVHCEAVVTGPNGTDTIYQSGSCFRTNREQKEEQRLEVISWLLSNGWEPMGRDRFRRQVS
jgi:hypothetical protein